MNTTTNTSFDIEAARRRRFDGGMAAHGDPDGVIDERRKFVARTGEPERFCPRCTHHKPAAAAVCRPCTVEAA